MSFLPSWFPGGGFKRKAAIGSVYLQELYDAPYNMVREKMVGRTLYLWVNAEFTLYDTESRNCQAVLYVKSRPGART